MTWYPTQLHHLVTDLAIHCPILLMSSTRIGSDKYQSHVIALTRPVTEFLISCTEHNARAPSIRPPRSVNSRTAADPGWPCSCVLVIWTSQFGGDVFGLWSFCLHCAEKHDSNSPHRTQIICYSLSNQKTLTGKNARVSCRLLDGIDLVPTCCHQLTIVTHVNESVSLLYRAVFTQLTFPVLITIRS